MTKLKFINIDHKNLNLPSHIIPKLSNAQSRGVYGHEFLLVCYDHASMTIILFECIGIVNQLTFSPSLLK
jgi:hypothetical protein